MKKQTPFYDDRLYLWEFGKISVLSQKQKNILSAVFATKNTGEE